MTIGQGPLKASDPSTMLPAEIGFLAQYGHPPQLLRAAALHAERVGVSAETVLLKHGLVDERSFYRALADACGVPFLSSPPVSALAAYPAAVLTGLAPLAPPQNGFVLAPRGASLVQLLKARRMPAGIMGITAPSLLARAVLETRADGIAHDAANRLPERLPGLSSRDGASYGQIGWLAALCLIVSGGVTLDPAVSFAITGAALGPLFLGLVVLRLAASLLENAVAPAIPPPRAADVTLPTYTIIVALYRERRIASRLIAALTRLDYPAAKLDIKLVLEEDDRETIEAVFALDLPGFIEVIIAPPGEPRTKPRALNVALPLARGEFTVVYDAEDVPDPDQLRLAVDLFRREANVACLQARLVIDNTEDSWLTRLFTIEYAALFDVMNPGLVDIGCPIPLGGTSNHFRTAVLKDLCGWDAWNVTEDADLGIRLARRGYRVADLPSSTLEEAPIALRAWMRQRSRWMKGFMQTCLSHSRAPGATLAELGFWRFYGAAILMAGTVLSALGYPIFTAAFLIPHLAGQFQHPATDWEALWYAVSITLFLFGLAAMIVPACVALKRRRLGRLLPWVALLPLYYCLVSLAAWRGLWELIAAPFRWNKTSHGHARTSRSGLLQKHQARAEVTTSLKTALP